MFPIASVNDNRQEYFLKVLSQSIEKLDFKHVQIAHKIDSKTSIDNLIEFALENLTHNYHTVRITSATIIKRMSSYLIKSDVEQLNRHQEQQDKDTSEWHLLHKFRKVLLEQNEWTRQYIDEFKLVLST